jgi:hypothetical protein
LRRLILIAALALACTEITGDSDRIIALEILGPLLRTVEEGDTLQLEARALDANGDVVPDAVILWAVVDTAVVGFTIGETTGLVETTARDTGRVAAIADELPSEPVLIQVTPAADSVASVSATRDTVDSGEPASAALTVEVLDTTSDTLPLPLTGKPVHFDLVEPPPGEPAGAGIFLATTDTVPGADPHHLEVVSQALGQAWVVVRKVSGTTPPDSAVVHATVVTATGDTVAGSPVRFVVLFQ